METANTIGTRASVSGKLTAKDFVFIAIFGALLFLVFMVFSMVFSMNANICWFTHSIGAIPAGIIWMYLLYRVPKRGTIAIMGAVVGLLGLIMGMFWTGPVGVVVGALLAELVLGNPDKRTTAKMIVAFPVFVVSFWLGQISLIFISGPAYVDMCVAAGMTVEYGQTLVDFVFGPLCFVAGATTVAGSLLGGFFGSRVFVKHFAKMGL